MRGFVSLCQLLSKNECLHLPNDSLYLIRRGAWVSKINFYDLIKTHFLNFLIVWSWMFLLQILWEKFLDFPYITHAHSVTFVHPGVNCRKGCNGRCQSANEKMNELLHVTRHLTLKRLAWDSELIFFDNINPWDCGKLSIFAKKNSCLRGCVKQRLPTSQGFGFALCRCIVCQDFQQARMSSHSGRRRSNVRQYSAEDQALTQISKEVGWYLICLFYENSCICFWSMYIYAVLPFASYWRML